MAKLTDDEIARKVEQAMSSSTGWMGDTVSEQQADALHYYEGEPLGNEKEDRSQIVSRDVMETIEWMMPALLKPFVSNQDTVEFEPTGVEDIDAAKQATEYVNYVVMRDNPGFLNYYTWFKDTLLNKNGIVKFWWDETPHTVEEEYRNLSTPEASLLVEPEDKRVEVEVLEHTPYPGVDDIYHDLRIKRTETRGRVKIEAVPPEEFLISRWAKSLEDRKFVGHRFQRTRSELREEGYKEDVVKKLPRADSIIYEHEQAQERFDDDLWPFNQDGEEDANTPVWITECYLDLDIDGKGISEQYKVVVGGGPENVVVLDKEPCEDLPFADLCAVIMPHKFYGKSVAELVMDIQEIKTAVIRGMLDSLYYANNPETAVVQGEVNLDDFLTSRPGGIKRTKRLDAFKTIERQWVGGQSFPMLDYLDQTREARTGGSIRAAGLDPDALQNQTAEGVRDSRAAIQSRIELIARTFAETGVKKLYKGILKLTTKYQDKERVVRLTNEWVPVDPRSWNVDMDMAINVGLGTGNTAEKVANINLIANKQGELWQALGPQNPLVSLENLYNTVEDLAHAADLPAERYVTKPQEGASIPQEDGQAAAQAELQKAQLEIESNERIALAKVQSEQQVALIKAQAEAALQHDKSQAEMGLKEMELTAEIAFERAKMQFTPSNPAANGNVPSVQ